MSHDAHTHADQEHFAPAEWSQLRADDRSGARAISGLMVGIFSAGLVLYAIVAWTL